MGNTCDGNHDREDLAAISRRSIEKLRESKRQYPIPKFNYNNEYSANKELQGDVKLIFNNDSEAIAKYGGFYSELVNSGKTFVDTKFALNEHESYRLDRLFGPEKPTTRIPIKNIEQKDKQMVYLSAVFCFIAEHLQLVPKILITQINEQGFNILRIYPNGSPTLVVIDNLLPAEDRDPKYTNANIYVAWMFLLEKAWAKMVGSYEAAKGLSPEDAIQELLGIPSFSYEIHELYRNQEFEKIFTRKNTILILTGGGVNRNKGLYNYQVFYFIKIEKSSTGRLLFHLVCPYKDFNFVSDIGYENDDKNGMVVMSEQQILSQFQFLTVGYYKQKYQNTFYPLNFKNQPIYYGKFQILREEREQIAIRIAQIYEQYINDPEYEYSPVYIRLFNSNTGALVAQGCRRSDGCFKSANVFDNVLELVEGQYFMVIQIEWIRQDLVSTANLLIYSSRQITIEKMGRLEGQPLYKKFLAQRVPINSISTKDTLQYATIKGKSIFIMLRNTHLADLNLIVTFQNIYNLRPVRETMVKNTIHVTLSSQETKFIEFRRVEPSQPAELNSYSIQFR